VNSYLERKLVSCPYLVDNVASSKKVEDLYEMFAKFKDFMLNPYWHFTDFHNVSIHERQKYEYESFLNDRDADPSCVSNLKRKIDFIILYLPLR
jgi:hypothetical protein